MRLVALTLLVSGCAVSFTIRPDPVCAGIKNEARADCEDVADNVRVAVKMFGRGGRDVVAKSDITITSARHLYRNESGEWIAGTTQCLDGKPVIILDRSMGALLHELFHAQDCLDGRLPLTHDWTAEKTRRGVRYFYAIHPPRRVWTAEEVAEERFAIGSRHE